MPVGRTLLPIASGGGSPSGIAYQQVFPLFSVNISYAVGDSISRYYAGEYDRVNPVYPASYAMVDYTAVQSDVRVTPATGTLSTDPVSPTILVNNNAFGNRYRFTDDAGNPSDASVGSNIWAHVNWRSHSFTGATDQYVIDHLTGWGYCTEYVQDGTFYNMTPAPNGQSWNDWMIFTSTMGTYKGMTGWMPLDLSDFFGPAGVAAIPTGLWGDFFWSFEPTEAGISRGSFITGESTTASGFEQIRDTGNAIAVDGLGKVTGTGFAQRIANLFVKRIHY